MRLVNLEINPLDAGGIRVKAISRFSGEEHEMVLPMSLDEFGKALEDWEARRVPIQEAFPTLTDQQREFLMTGSTQEEWDKAFPEDDEDEKGD